MCERLFFHDQMQLFQSTNVEGINIEEFRELIVDWMRKDQRAVRANKAAVAFLVAPLFAVMTKSAGKQVPQVRNAVEKMPTALLFSIFSVGLLLLQDSRMGKQ